MSVKAMSLVWDAKLKPGQKLVLLAIADHADGKGVCWPGQEFIAEKCGMNRSTVNQHIVDLEKEGFLLVEKKRSECGRQAPSIYTINFDRLKNPELENTTRITKKSTKPRVAKSNTDSVGKRNPGNQKPELENPALENPALENPALEKHAARVGNSNSYTLFNEPSRNHQYLCADPSGSPQAVIKIPLNIAGTFHEIFSVDIENYSQLYPAVDVLQQLRNMVGWCDGNPTKRKTKDGIKRFINSWLAKDQDRGGSKFSKAHQPQSAGVIPQYIPPEQRNAAGSIIDSTATRL